jgi:hypothetical protein
LSCAQAFESDRAARYVGGDLSDEERDAFETHYLDCAECLRAVQALAELPAALRAAPAKARALPSASRLRPMLAWAGAVVVGVATGYVARDRREARPVLRSGTQGAGAALAVEDVRELTSDGKAATVPRGVVLLVLPVPSPEVGERIEVVLRDAAGAPGFEAPRVAVRDGRARIVVDAGRLAPGGWRLEARRIGADQSVKETVAFPLDVR